jgi:hypothetical protein
MNEVRSEVRRGSRTRFDRSERTIILGAVGAVVLVALVLIGVYFLTQQGASSRAFDTPPRNLDFWAIYPNGQVRFATLYYPDDSQLPTEEDDESVTAAGPLVPSESAILSTTIIGGEEELIEVLPGPGENSILVYPLATLKRTIGEPYGIDVLTNSSPYLTNASTIADVYQETPLPPDAKILSLGIGEVGAGYRQVVVAVALPRGSRVLSTGNVEDGEVMDYRHINIGDWTVYYFETTNAVITDAIRIQFVLSKNSPDEDLDIMEVDRRR